MPGSNGNGISPWGSPYRSRYNYGGNHNNVSVTTTELGGMMGDRVNGTIDMSPTVSAPTGSDDPTGSCDTITFTPDEFNPIGDFNPFIDDAICLAYTRYSVVATREDAEAADLQGLYDNGMHNVDDLAQALARYCQDKIAADQPGSAESIAAQEAHVNDVVDRVVTYAQSYLQLGHVTPDQIEQSGIRGMIKDQGIEDIGRLANALKESVEQSNSDFGYQNPSSTVPGTSHRMEFGESLWSVVQNHLGPSATDRDIMNLINLIAQQNNISDPNVVKAGAVIYIPEFTPGNY